MFGIVEFFTQSFRCFLRKCSVLFHIAFVFPRKTFRRRVLQKIVGVSHTTHIPHISIQHVSHQYVSHQYVSIQYLSIQCAAIQKVRTYPVNTYRFHTYPCNAYPFNAYPFKRFASAGMAMYVNANHILAYHCISRNGNVCECKTYPCISLHQQEWQCM